MNPPAPETRDLPAATTRVPTDHGVTAHCPHCDRPFPTENDRDLHMGERHPDAMTESQRAAYEAAREQERDDLYLFHIKVIFTLGVL
jgi:hypothetical protein